MTPIGRTCIQLQTGCAGFHSRKRSCPCLDQGTGQTSSSLDNHSRTSEEFYAWMTMAPMNQNQRECGKMKRHQWKESTWFQWISATQNFAHWLWKPEFLV